MLSFKKVFSFSFFTFILFTFSLCLLVWLTRLCGHWHECSERQPENEANEFSRASNQKTPSSISPHSQRRSVTMEERRGAELAARALKTANPSVMVVLTKSSVQYHFCLVRNFSWTSNHC